MTRRFQCVYELSVLTQERVDSSLSWCKKVGGGWLETKGRNKKNTVFSPPTRPLLLFQPNSYSLGARPLTSVNLRWCLLDQNAIARQNTSSIHSATVLNQSQQTRPPLLTLVKCNTYQALFSSSPLSFKIRDISSPPLTYSITRKKRSQKRIITIRLMFQSKKIYELDFKKEIQLLS